MPVQRDQQIATHIRREGMLFFTLQLAAALAFSADLPLISALRGSTEAGTYAIAQRLFSIVPLGLSLIWAPLWPIYRHALASGDHAWAVRTLRRSVLFAVLAACACAAILALEFDRIVGLWVHRPLAVSGVLLAGFALWCTIEAAGAAISTFLNAASIMRYQVIVASTFSITCLAAKIVVLKTIGITGLPWTTAAVYLATSMLPTAIMLPRLVRGALARTY